MRTADRTPRELGLTAGRDWMRAGHDGDERRLIDVLHGDIPEDLAARIGNAPWVLCRLRVADDPQQADREFWEAFIEATSIYVVRAASGVGSNRP